MLEIFLISIASGSECRIYSKLEFILSRSLSFAILICRFKGEYFKMKFLFAAVVLLSFSTVIFAQRSNDNEPTKQLYALFDSEWEYNLKESPTFASYLGDKRYNDKWSDNSLAAIERRNQHTKDALEQLKKIDRAKLSVADQLNYDLFQKDLEQSLESFQYKQFLAPVSQQGGIQTQDELAQFINFTNRQRLRRLDRAAQCFSRFDGSNSGFDARRQTRKHNASEDRDAESSGAD